MKYPYSILKDLEILQLYPYNDPNAPYSIEYIKKKYKTLILKYHPDKLGYTQNDIIPIIQAYNNILNSNLFHKNTHSKNTKSNYIINNLTNDLSNILFDYLNDLTKEYKQELTDTLHQHSKLDIHLQLNVSLKDIYESNIKKITTKILKSHNPQIFLTQHLYIKLANFQTFNLFKFKGDFCNKCSLINQHFRGNLSVKLNVISDINYPHISLNQNNKSIDYILNINLYEYLYGVNKNIYLFKNLINVSCKHIYKLQNSTLVLKNKGIKYYCNITNKYITGDLNVIFSLYIFHKSNINELFLKDYILKDKIHYLFNF
jgi:DnaJ-class molecular chaperone